MTKKFNPYEVLGVPPDASPEDIKAAGKRAAKKLHPDAGGTAEEFAENRRALAILSSPTKREKFDRTGSVEDEAADAKTKRAAQIVLGAIMSTTNDFLASDFKPEKDPRTFNLMAAVQAYIRDQIANGHKALATGKRHEEFLRDFAKRFKQSRKVKSGPTFDFLSASLKDEIRSVMEKQEMVEADLDVAKLALEIALTYDFEFTRPQPDPQQWGTMVAAAGLLPGGGFFR